MRTIAFVGPSGTGKSHRAQWVASKNNIEYIIDDGLLISGNRVVAGCSAKKESTKLASVRRALFSDHSHCESVKKAIRENGPEAILVLGTSLNMIESIAKALEMPEISQVITIEEIASKEEIEKARNMRMTEGKHVIPVPTFEIKKDFSGYFIDPLRVFRRDGKNSATFVAEKSVVRPTFSYMGNYIISDNVIYAICQFEACQTDEVVKVGRMWLSNRPSGLTVNMDLIMKYGGHLPQAARKVQARIKDAIEKYTALNVIAINIVIKSLRIE